MIVTILLLVSLALLVHYCVLHYSKIGRIMNKIPGPRALPLVGNLHLFQGSTDHLWKLIRDMGNEYYPIYRLWSFTMPLLNVRHPDHLEAVLGNMRFIRKSLLYWLIEPWFGTGLLTSAGTKWQKRRKILTPAFHFNVLQQFVDIFIEESEHMCEQLKEERKPVVRDLMPLVSEHTLNVICETAMGTSLRGKGKGQEQYRKAVYDIGKVFVYRLVRPWFHTNFIFSLVPRGWEQSRVLKILHGFTTRIINERKEYHDQTGGRYLAGLDGVNGNIGTPDDNEFGIRKRRLAMLDLLIAAQRDNQIDDLGIREEVDTFMFEGHDTTAMCICFTIMLLAEHKEIQDRARAEFDEVLQENDGKVTMSALQRLNYLERCIKESLRLYPSVHFISRDIEEEVTLSGYTVPADSMVHIHIVDAHRDPNFWPNPEVYDPDRFLPEQCHGRHPYSYVPFSAGPRNCIGQRFAMLELKTTIGLLLHNFYFEPVDYLKDIHFIADLVIRPSHPIRTRFVPVLS